uniref:ATP synthase F0 subunit 8 n=1 Tax=Pseudotibiozus cerasopus TaxID=2931677 RepID=A0A8T9JBU9_9MYRI|nr:ATP synthase F0 subunit 8 [Pseudotibiozus cerasopus]UOF70234.1 ATP synthase F0 subunit 8 [Pseudotibiozus cerasopus]
MPQMFPLNWIMMFIMFFLIYMNSIIMMYYNYSQKPMNKILHKISLMTEWQW